MKKSFIILMVLILSFFTYCEKENQLPTCAITCPNNGDEFKQGDTIAISVEAKDNDGLIAEVNFYINDIGTFSSSSFPYEYSWNTLDETIGDHIIKVIAIDNDGGSQTDECTILIIGDATIVTTEVSSITHNSAMSGGNVTDNGGATVTTRGVCWNTSQNPTTVDNKTTDGSGTGSFTSLLTGLTQNTIYYVRAYATNSFGTSYGSEVTFTTLGIPSLTTTAISSITENSAKSGGNVTYDGGATITTRGVCWNTSQNPTTVDNKTTDGSGTGSFTSLLTGLTQGIKYYVRAYATNSFGTAYGNEASFTTDVSAVQIGNQVWMAENLKATHYADGTAIQLVEDSLAWDALGHADKAYCYYNNNSSNGDTYGVLYTWPAVMNGASGSDANPSGVQGICPDGWHVPSDAEWTQLTDYLGGESVAGGKLKETGTSHWESPNTGATNESGFTALPGGVRHRSGSFKYVGSYGDWWSSTIKFGAACNRETYYLSSYLYFGLGYNECGLSVRCVKDD